MFRYSGALCWAAAILLLAIAARSGLVDRAAAEMLLLALPAIAFITLLNGRNCRRAGAQ